MRLHTLIDMSNEMLVCVIGALVQYIYDNKLTIDDSSGQINISHIQSIPCSVLYIDNHTRQQLNIFQTVSHPDASNTNKEGTSLYQHLNQCKTNNGSKLLRYIYHTPTSSYSITTYQSNTILVNVSFTDNGCHTQAVTLM